MYGQRYPIGAQNAFSVLAAKAGFRHRNRIPVNGTSGLAIALHSGLAYLGYQPVQDGLRENLFPDDILWMLRINMQTLKPSILQEEFSVYDKSHMFS